MASAHSIDKDKYKPRAALAAGAASLAVVVVLIAVKLIAYIYSGSSSVFASLMDSIVDVTASAMSFLAIHLSLKPADKNHRSGHGKIEGLAALLQSLLILGGGFSLMCEAAARLFAPKPVEAAPFAIAIMLFSIILSILLIRLQNKALQSAPSLAVESDKAHYSMDILVNSGVIAVLILLQFGVPLWIDPLFSLLVSFYLAFTAWTIARKGLDMLLDHELPKQTRAHILDIIQEQNGVLGVHDLRTSQSGMRVFISFDIEADPNLSLIGAHDIARKVEESLLNIYPHADIMIHVDPHGDTADSRHMVKAT